MSVTAELDIPVNETNNAQGISDDAPPAWDDVCEKASGGDDRAFELCITYCEALDWDLGSDSEPCEQLREDYVKITGGAIPCDCPCIGGHEGWTEVLESIDEGACYREIQNGEGGAFFGILLYNGHFPAAENIEPPACGNANEKVGEYLIIEQNQADQCISLLTSIVESNNLVPCMF